MSCRCSSCKELARAALGVELEPVPCNIEILTECLESGYSAPVIEAFLRLADNETARNLDAAYKAWTEDNGIYNSGDFIAAVESLVGSYCFMCGCDEITWTDDGCTTGYDETVCESCLDDNYSYCDCCSQYWSETEPLDGGDTRYCERCINQYCSWCEHCEEYYRNDEGGCPNDECSSAGCDCDAPHLSFTFPADGHGVIGEDERLTVELPKGTIDEGGLAAIKRYLWEHGIAPEQRRTSGFSYEDRYIWSANRQFVVSSDGEHLDWGIVEHSVTEIGPEWQAKRGNFTRRLSSFLYKNYDGLKLPPGVISEIGNLARTYSSEGTVLHIELTRELNRSAEEFHHGDSCWWGGYSLSRCCLKNWGGLAMRSYASDNLNHDPSYMPNGRVWIQPLNEDLQPTHDALDAFAYVVFNGYGALEQVKAARVISYLTSRTYKKIGYSAEGQYVNAGGYLVADEATCSSTDSINLRIDPHDQLDAHTYNTERQAVA